MSENTMTADVNSTQDGQLEFLVKGDHHPQNGITVRITANTNPVAYSFRETWGMSAP